MPNLTWIIIAVGILIVLWAIAIFNGLVMRRRRVDEAWADIDVQLKRRYDLIPNLVETVKGYATHESSVFEKVTKARSAAMGAQGTANRAQAENMLTDTLKSLFAVTEAYPDLKASASFIKLHDELFDAEDKIMAARRFYNGNVRDYNIVLEQFPSNVIAGIFNFKIREFFEITDDKERETPQVKF